MRHECACEFSTLDGEILCDGTSPFCPLQDFGTHESSQDAAPSIAAAGDVCPEPKDLAREGHGVRVK
jgi:hypothetical protein